MGFNSAFKRLNTTPRCSPSEIKTRKHKDRQEIWLDIFKQLILQLEILKRLYHEGHGYFTNHLFACICLVQSHSHTTLFFNLCERQCPCWFLFTLIVSVISFPWYCLFCHFVWKLVSHNKDVHSLRTGRWENYLAYRGLKSGQDVNLYLVEIHEWFSLSCISKIIKSKGTKWLGHATCMWEKRNVHKFGWKPEGKSHLKVIALVKKK
jgi:hypothetical protein